MKLHSSQAFFGVSGRYINMSMFLLLFPNRFNERIFKLNYGVQISQAISVHNMDCGQSFECPITNRT